MRTGALAIAALCAVLTTSLALGAGGPNGQGPDGQGPPGHVDNPSGQDNAAVPPMSPAGQLAIGAEQNAARAALDAGRALPLADISARVTAALGARLIDARLISTGGVLVYRLIVLTSQGVSRRIYVDARTGDTVPAR